MSREDEISQLFIKNEHKLDEAPTLDLWSKIETKLNAEDSAVKEIEQPKTKTLGIGYKRVLSYFTVAASLLLIIVAVYYMKPANSSSDNLAQNDSVQDLELNEIEEPLPTSESEKQSIYENNDRLQQKKMIETARKYAAENKKTEGMIDEFGLDKIEINEKSEDLIVLSVERNSDEDKSYIAKPKAENLDFNGSMSNVVNRNEYQQAGKAYADPPIITQIDQVEKVNSKAEISNLKTNSVGPIIKSKSSKRENSQKLDGQMQIFEWLLGQWVDNEEEGGKSIEVWRKVNNNSIECTGTKISGKNKIFEEKLSIYFDKESKTVMLNMPIDDYKKTVLYMMISHNSDRIVFEQTENIDMPSNLIFQRSLNGYSVVINSESKPLKPAQQTYFEHRNRVSDTKILRILTPSKD